MNRRSAKRPERRDNLPSLRERIDRLDLQLLRLLNQRAVLALRVGQLKRQQGRPVFDRRREAEVLRRLTRANPGPFSSTSVAALFRDILRHSRQLEASTKVRAKNLSQNP